jgi:hypothetical protein
MGLATIGAVGCGANIPDVSEIDENPKADPEAMRKAMEEMQKRMKESAGGRSVSTVDIDKQVETTTGGDKK